MNIKKYIILISAVCVAIFCIFSLNGKTVKVSAIEIKETKANRTVSCSGKIESKNVTAVELDFPVIFENVYFKAGEKVEKGDVLAVIDKKKTIDYLSNLLTSYSSAISLSNLSSLPIDSIATLIPENIIAPVSGIISGCEIDGEKYINIQAPIFSISDDSDLVVRLSVGETQIASIKKGQYAVISGQGFSGKHYGKVTEISASARENFSLTGSNTVVDVFVSVAQKGNSLKPGLTAGTKILTSVKENAILIPYESILQDDNNNEYVYIINNDIAQKRIIKTGIEYEDGTEVLNGLSVGELIVEDPSEIKNGTKVKIA